MPFSAAVVEKLGWYVYALLEKYDLIGLEAEWFPPRWAHTEDQSGCDIAAYLTLSPTDPADSGTRPGRMLVSIEVKYTDSFSRDEVTWDRYAAHLEPLGLTPETTRELHEAGCSQVLRQVMITDSVARTGLVPGADEGGHATESMAVVLARHDDKTAQAVVDRLAAAVNVPVRFWSHRDFFTTLAREDRLREWATAMLRRYVPDA